VLAGRVVGSAILGAPDVPMPFRQTVGGSNMMRGYHSYRLRANRLLTATLESRWRVHRSVDVVPFAEMAAVGGPPVRLPHAAVIPAWGIGVRWWPSDRFVVRGEVGISPDERRVFLTIGTPF
jgi:hemolysin activation/secretion protein